MKIQDHDELPKLDHFALGRDDRAARRLPFPGARPGNAGSHLGIFQTANLGKITPAATSGFTPITRFGRFGR